MTTLQPHTSSNSHHLQQQLAQSKYSNKVHSINDLLMKQLQEQLQSFAIVIPQKERPFKLKRGSQQHMASRDSYQHNNNHNPSLQMSQILTKRHQIELQLQRLTHQQQKLHTTSHHPHPSPLTQSHLSSSSPSRMFRSQLTQQQKQKIRQVLTQQKRFIKQLKQKEEEYYQQLEEDRRERERAEEGWKVEKCQERRAYWERVRSEVEQRQQERGVRFGEQQRRLEEVKRQRKLYQVLEDSWTSKLAQDEEMLKQATSHMRLNHKFDLKAITEHQQHYESLSKQKQQSRQQSLTQFQQKMKLTLPKIPNSKFFNILKDEEKRKKEEEEEKERKKYELGQKKQQFAKMVKEHYKPKVDEGMRERLGVEEQEAKKDSNKRDGLPLGEIRNLGNDYMREVHKNVGVVNKGSQPTISQSKITPTLQQSSPSPTTKPAHMNYLTQLKQRRSQQTIKASLTNEVTRIMRNSNYSTVEKIERAKLVARRLQGKENTKSSALVSSINEKMRILRVLNQNAG